MAYSTPALDTPAEKGRRVRTVEVQTTQPLREAFRPPSSRRKARRDRGVFNRFRRDNPLADASLITVGLTIVGATLRPRRSPYYKDAIDLTSQYLAPSLDHPFGTDDLGRDIFVRVMHGGRVSLAVGFLALALAVA